MVDPIALKQVPLFQELDDAALTFLASHVEVLHLEPEQEVYRERDPGDALYIVDQGELAISKVIDWDEMSEKVLATVGKDSFFGEMSLLDSEPRSATVKSIGTSRILRISRQNFLALMDQSSRVATKLLLSIIKTVNGRLRQTNRQLVTLYDTGKIIGSVRDLPTLASEIVERIVESIGVARGLLILLNPYSGELEIKHHHGYTLEEEAMFQIRADTGLLALAFESRKPHRHEGDLPPETARAGFETKSMLVCPLVNGDLVTGAIVIGDKTNGQPFTNDDENLLTGVAAQVATAVENARMVEERDAKERHERVYITY